MRLIIYILIILLLPFNVSSAPLIWDGNFDSNDVWGGRNAAFGVWHYSCMIQPAYVEVDPRGGYAVRITTISTDQCNTNGERSQLSGTTEAGEVEGAELYYGFSVKFMAPWTNPVGYGSMYWEVHDSQGNANVMLAIHNVNGVQKHQLGITGGSSHYFRYKTDFINANVGSWEDFVIYVKWSTGSSGLVKVYHKLSTSDTYTLVAQNSGSNLKNPFLKNLYSEIGNYRTHVTDTQIVKLAHYEIGTTFADVSMGVSSYIDASDPALVSQWNSKTSDNDTTIIVNTSESVMYSARFNQTITSWSYSPGSNITSYSNYMNLTYSYPTTGIKTVSISGSNPNGSSNTARWTVDVRNITIPANPFNSQAHRYGLDGSEFTAANSIRNNTYWNSTTWKETSNSALGVIRVFDTSDFGNTTTAIKMVNCTGPTISVEYRQKFTGSWTDLDAGCSGTETYQITNNSNLSNEVRIYMYSVGTGFSSVEFIQGAAYVAPVTGNNSTTGYYSYCSSGCNGTWANTTFPGLIQNQGTGYLGVASSLSDYLHKYKFDENTGSIAYDQNVAVSQPIGLYNSPVWVTGKYGYGLQFDGLDYGNYPLTNVPSDPPISVSMWINKSSTSSWDDLVRKNGSWAVQLNSNGYLSFEITDIVDKPSSVSIPLNTWIHVAVTWNGTVIKYYANGILLDSEAASNTPNAGTPSLLIGGGYSGFNGKIDELLIFDRVLTNDEINITRDNTANGSGNLISSFDSGSGNEIDQYIVESTGMYSSVNTTNISIHDNLTGTQIILILNPSRNLTVNTTLYSGLIQKISYHYETANLSGNIYIDFNFSDPDNDTGTFFTNFSYGSLNTTTGIYTWSPNASQIGLYNAWFQVNDSYGSISGTWIQFNVNSGNDYIPGVPITPYIEYTDLCNGGLDSNCVSVTWLPGTGNSTNLYNVKVNDDWNNGSLNNWIDRTDSAHMMYNFIIYGFNSSGNGTQSLTPLEFNFTYPNHNVSIDNLSYSDELTEGDNWTGLITASDYDGDTLSYSDNHSGIITNNITGEFYWQIGNNTHGNYTVRFYVNDSYGSSSYQDVSIEVLNGYPEIYDITTEAFTWSNQTPIIYYAFLYFNSTNIDNFTIELNGTIYYSEYISWSNYTIIDNVNYTFHVRGYNTNLSIYTPWFNNTYLNVSVAPWEVLNLSNGTVTQNSVVLTWNASLDLDNNTYEGFIDGIHEFFTQNITYNVTGLSALTPYNFTVRVNDTSGNWGANSTELLIDTLADNSTPNYIPGDPSGLTYSNGSTWVNHTWTVGAGNITNYYHVLHNGTWTNNSVLPYLNKTVGFSNYSNITVWAYNNSGTGELSLNSVTQSVLTPANVSSPVNAPNITGIHNNNTLNSTLNFTVYRFTNVRFNLTANQTISSWSGSGLTWSVYNTTSGYAIKNLSTLGLNTLTGYGINTNGVTNTITWSVTVLATPGNNSLSGTIFGPSYTSVQNFTLVPLVNASVTIDGTGETVYTDANGLYTFANVSVGSHSLRVVPENSTNVIYFAKNTSTTVTGNNTLNITAKIQSRKVTTPGFEAPLLICVFLLYYVRRKSQY